MSTGLCRVLSAVFILSVPRPPGGPAILIPRVQDAPSETRMCSLPSGLDLATPKQCRNHFLWTKHSFPACWELKRLAQVQSQTLTCSSRLYPGPSGDPPLWVEPPGLQDSATVCHLHGSLIIFMVAYCVRGTKVGFKHPLTFLK